MSYSVLVGDALSLLAEFPADSIDCCVTSPPYYGLRDYGIDGQLGLEETPDEYVAKLVAIFGQVKRVLKPEGTLWLNLGDSYGCANNRNNAARQVSNCSDTSRDVSLQFDVGTYRKLPGIKQKDLLGIPWMVAFALRADGWYLRQDIIWHKPNPMPESVTDRCTKAHEYVFLFSKNKSYYFDHTAMREPSVDPKRAGKLERSFSTSNADVSLRQDTGRAVVRTEFRNMRSVWNIATTPYKGAHFATFPPKLIAPCVMAGCPVGGVVLDPFGGSGTTAGVAEANGRNSILIELNPEYAALVDDRVRSIVERKQEE